MAETEDLKKKQEGLGFCPPANRPCLTELLPDEIVRELNSRTIPALPDYRGGQIFSWLSRGVMSFSGMTDLPLPLRQSLEESFSAGSTGVESLFQDQDGTQKLKIRLFDGLFIESVLLTDRAGRRTACLSTQAGCAMGCLFCRTGGLGLKRNLSAGEITEQFLHLLNLTRPSPVLRGVNIVFMGMGEGLANYPAFMKAVSILSHPQGLGLSPARMTVSTCGLVPGILALGREKRGPRLAVSLNSALEEKRRFLMPGAAGWSLGELKEALLDYQSRKKERLTLEYVLLSGFNDRREDLQALINFIPPLRVQVNLIPYNPLPAQTAPPRRAFTSPGPESTQGFYRGLQQAGVKATLRYSRGRSTNSACGQLAGE
ncbi:MAG: 23S rRNA (adenine(2503)-C(2))-methyltransferase RlmN [Spirochaetales bacterium]|jgi:23S rRNA (adenine2503-C2)-methyltransferase|nr:23S rRNA (adenine(2503)-C(2))-methyltransferase RlmN [Spirochaetales bacterium]